MPLDYSQALQGALNILSSSNQPIDPNIDSSFLTPGAIDDPSITRDASIAGMLAPTKSGRFSESLSSSYGASADAKTKAMQLRAQYLPAIANAITQRQLAKAQIQNVNAEGALHQLQAVQAMRQQQMIESLLGGTGMLGGGGDSFGAGQGALAATSAQGDNPATQAYPSLYPQGKNVGPTVNAANATPQAASRPAIGAFGAADPSAVAFDLAFNGGKGVGQLVNGAPDVVKGLRSIGIDPMSPQGRQIVLNSVAKPIAARPGGWIVYPDGHREWMPNIEQGGMPVYDNNGNVAGVAPMPGATGVAQAVSQAKQTGTTLGNTVSFVGPNGEKRTAVMGDVYGGLVPSVIRAESGGNPSAVSPKGAAGTMQLMPGTAGDLGINPSDALENVAGGVSYLGKLRQKYGNDAVALAAYNWGPGNVDKWLKDGGDFNKLPQETQQYVSTVLSNAKQQQPQAAQPAQPAGLVTEASPGDVKLRDMGAKSYESIVNEGQSVGQDRNILQEMRKLADEGKFGPGTEGTARLKALVGNVPGLPDSWRKDVQSAQTSQDVLRKLASNMAMGRLGSGSQTGTDSQLETLLNSFPHGEMTNEAIKQVLPMLERQVNAREVRLNAATNYLKSRGNDMKSLQDFNAAWSKYGDPVAIEYGRQLAIAQARGDAAAQKAIADSINRRADKADLKAKLQGLNSLGAF